MSKSKEQPKIAIITLIQEGAVKIGGEHAMLFPYVEQIIKTAETLKGSIKIIPYVISPKPKDFEPLERVEELKAKMNQTNNGKMILVDNGTEEPYANPWNWEKYGFEANNEMIKLNRNEKFDGIIVMAHGYASIPAILNLNASRENGDYGKIPIKSYYITHSSFDEHKDNRPQRRILEREIQNHSKMIAISPYMGNHLEQIKLVNHSSETIPLYNALPKKGWFSRKVPKETILEMLSERNSNIGKGPFYGTKLPIDDILQGKKELVLYFGRAQKYVKGTDAVIYTAKNDSKRHYMLICSGSDDDLKWHKAMLKNTDNITLAWEHNSKLVLGTVQLTESSDARIYALFLSRREPMGLVSREVVLMQDKGSVLPVVSDSCGFDDKWQTEFSFTVTNPCFCEDDPAQIKANSTMAKDAEIFIHDDCIQSTLDALDKLSELSTEELQSRVSKYRKAVETNYTQDRYWAFYLQAVSNILPLKTKEINDIVKENNLQVIPNV